ncbi:hypothetical protein DCCM_2406 [Desulfocucumis palustris]|uniref:Tricarboxylate transport protein TctC n=1 Tax=Desulfocucumis palustris TaxID=1898651 RepID=A0A2L2XAL0_9FIRM|nr:tripartite tricarboxylate transporter substrate binding protein [Desulfocucumis palustris]GBF33307.1 hypothetical protein DCCM_2406 [Desulfocucumis palustris]
MFIHTGRLKLFLILSLLVIAALAVSGCGGGGTGEQAKDDYPAKEITFLQWNDPGSAGDTYVRTITKLAEAELGQPIKIVTKTGGNGAEALVDVLKAPGDGYTLSHFSSSLSGFMNMPGFPAKAEDFDYLVRAQVSTYMLAVNSKLPIKNVDEFIAYAKQNPDKLSITGSRIGSVHHQNLFNMINEAGVSLKYVPQEGGSAALKEVLGGHVDGLVYDPAQILPYVQEGTLRPIVVFAEEKDANYPDVPTINEAGFKMKPSYQVRGVMAKKGIPDNRKEIIVNAFNKAMETAEWEEYLKKTNTTYKKMTPEDFTAEFLAETTEANDYLKKIGIVK